MSDTNNVGSPARRNIEQQEFFERSGAFTTSDRLTAFLYGLMRDHVTPGAVEQVMEATPLRDSYSLTNGYLALHAQDAAQRLAPSRGALVTCAHALEARMMDYARGFAERTKEERAASRQAVMDAAKGLRAAIRNMEPPDTDDEGQLCDAG